MFMTWIHSVQPHQMKGNLSTGSQDYPSFIEKISKQTFHHFGIVRGNKLSQFPSFKCFDS